MSQEKELEEIGIKIKNGEPLSDTEKRVYVDCYKKSWLEDPIWDMEDLGDQEGFEEFKEELLDFKKEREEKAKKWER